MQEGEQNYNNTKGLDKGFFIYLFIFVLIVIVAWVTVFDTTPEDNKFRQLFSTEEIENDEAAELRAHVRENLLIMNKMLLIESPTRLEQEEFLRLSTETLAAAEEAVSINPENSKNWEVLSELYIVLSMTGIEGAAERAVSAREKAESLKVPSNI